GRNRIYSESGKDITLSDGEWIIRTGTFGFVGFLAEFGLLTISVVRALSAVKFAESMHDGIFMLALTLILAINLIDLVPNSSISPWTWLLAGTLLGRAEAVQAVERRRGSELQTSLKAFVMKS